MKLEDTKQTQLLKGCDELCRIQKYEASIFPDRRVAEREWDK